MNFERRLINIRDRLLNLETSQPDEWSDLELARRIAFMLAKAEAGLADADEHASAVRIAQILMAAAPVQVSQNGIFGS